MTVRHVHVVGAGMAGLAASLSLAEAGVAVTIHEASPFAGGRCRSYFDRALGCRLDNGNHLLLSGNRATFAFLDQIGARDTMTGPGAPVFPFMDMASGERWVLRPNLGAVPWWMLVPGRRVPGMRLLDALPALGLHRAAPDVTVVAALRPGVLYRRLLEPLAIAALNTPPDQASARLLGAVVQETLAAGGAACIPAFPKLGLSESFVDPALAWLAARGATIRLGSRVGALSFDSGRVTAVDDIAVGADEAVILAVPAPAAQGLIPGLTAPDRFEAILNVHYRIDADPGPAGFIGLVGGTAEWIFIKPGIVSITISAGNRAVDTPHDALAQQVWGRCACCTASRTTHSAVSRRKGEEGDLRRDPGAGGQTAPGPDGAGESEPRGRLDGHRLARDYRRRH